MNAIDNVGGEEEENKEEEVEEEGMEEEEGEEEYEETDCDKIGCTSISQLVRRGCTHECLVVEDGCPTCNRTCVGMCLWLNVPNSFSFSTTATVLTAILTSPVL